MKNTKITIKRIQKMLKRQQWYHKLYTICVLCQFVLSLLTTRHTYGDLMTLTCFTLTTHETPYAPFL